MNHTLSFCRGVYEPQQRVKVDEIRESNNCAVLGAASPDCTDVEVKVTKAQRVAVRFENPGKVQRRKHMK